MTTSSTARPNTRRIAPAGDYTARHLSVLEGLEAVRKRPGMYIGSTDSRGLMQCVYEIIDNAVDEALEHSCDDIDVRIHTDGSVSVHDNGRGIPVDAEPKTGLSGVEVVFTKLHAGGKFGGGSYAATGGLHGVGASVVNALSARLDVEVDRGGKTYAMSFRHGEPGDYTDDKAGPRPDAPFTPYTDASELRVVGKTRRGVTGTRIRFWPDREVFLASADVSYDELLTHARQTAFLVPGVRVRIADDRGEPRADDIRHDGGITEFVDHLATDPPGTGHFKETVPVLDATGQLSSRELERECTVDVAMRWGTGYETEVRTFVNVIATTKGGTHLAGFEQALVKTFRKVVEANARKLKTGSDRPDKDDVLAGMTAVLTVRLVEPQFEGQTKEILGTSAVRGIVSRVVERELEARLTNPPRGEKQQSLAVVDKVVSEMKARLSARLHKETQRRKNALETSSLPAKLADCRSTDTDRSEVFIVEGDSALGTAKLARNSEFQALLPIRGKILNVQKASVADMLSNTECAAIIQVLGAGSGRTFDLASVRYGRVVIMTDADTDGAHIRTLLLTLFFKYMPELVSAGRVFAAVPPLHRVDVVGAGSRKSEIVYTYSDAELHRVLDGLDKKGRRYKPPQRYKGLGEMDAGQLKETTMDPRHRTLRRVTMADADAAGRMFELLMGNDVAPRKEFIVGAAASLDRDRIDA